MPGAVECRESLPQGPQGEHRGPWDLWNPGILGLQNALGCLPRSIGARAGCAADCGLVTASLKQRGAEGASDSHLRVRGAPGIAASVVRVPELQDPADPRSQGHAWVMLGLVPWLPSSLS